MKSKKIYIIRHGETDLNKAGIVQGRGVNADLNDTGRAQGEAFYDMYKNVPFKKLYTSTLKRTHQTTKGFIDGGIAWEQLSGLDEMAWGDQEGKQISTEVREEFKHLINQWNLGDYDARPLNGESPNEVAARQKEAINYILSKEDEDLVLVCMHGRAMRLLLCQLMNKPMSQMDDFPHQNTSLYILNYKEGVFEMETFNGLEHLDNI